MWNVAHLADCDINIRAMSTPHLFIIIRILNALVFKCFGWWRAWWKLFNTRIGRNTFDFYVFIINRFNSVQLFFFAMNITAILFNLIFFHILTYTCLFFSILEINECASHPCQHGTCTDGFNKYTCVCDPSFAGINCETSNNYHS